jgi:hypothetical protein
MAGAQVFRLLKMTIRVFSWVGITNERNRIKHYKGFPPELTGGKDERIVLPSPRLLVIEELKEGVFLDRFDEEGKPITDTWHRTVAEAKDQAIYEYKDLLSPWQEIPADVDPVEFAFKRGPQKGMK